jgi:hypothetical protein
MPLFLDQHPGGLSPEMVDAVRKKVQSGQTDQFGAKAVSVFWSDNETFCLSEAPSADVVHKAHEAMGVKLPSGSIRQVNRI